MKIAFVLHDFSLTGAPKLGLQIAEVLARDHEVTLITKKGGPVEELIPSGVFRDVINVETSHEVASLSLEERVDRAAELLAELDPDLVYVNSIAAGEWVSGARRSKRKVVLHVHELRRSIVELQRMRIYDKFDVSKADLVITASEECLKDVQRIFGFPPERLFNFGVCVNIEQVRRQSEEAPTEGVRQDGRSIGWGGKKRAERKLVAMCGQSSHRKGTDLFWQAAKAAPEHDFLWVGPWDDEVSALVNPALTLNRQKPLKNLYWTNLVRNPFSYLGQSDLFVLTAREDPNPLVVPEAISLGVPVVTFRNSGGSHVWTNRYGYSLTGDVDPDRIVDFMRRLFGENEYCDVVDETFLEEADLMRKTVSMMKELEVISSS